MSCYKVNNLVYKLEGCNDLGNEESNITKAKNQQISKTRLSVSEFNSGSSLNVWDNGFDLLERSNDCEHTSRNMLSCNNNYASGCNEKNKSTENKIEPFVISNTYTIDNNNVNVKNCNNKIYDSNSINENQFQLQKTQINHGLENESLFGINLEKGFNLNIELNQQFGDVQLPFNNKNTSLENNTCHYDSCGNKKPVKTFKSSLTNGSFFNGNRDEFWLGSSLRKNIRGVKKIEKKKVYKMKFKQYNPKNPSPLRISNCYTESSELSEDISCDTDSSKELELFSFNPFNTTIFSTETTQKCRKIGNIFNSFNNSLKTVLTGNSESIERKKKEKDSHLAVSNISDIFNPYGGYLQIDACSKGEVNSSEFNLNCKINVERHDCSEDKNEDEDDNEYRGNGGSNSADSVSSNESEENNDSGENLSDGVTYMECKEFNIVERGEVNEDVFKYEGFLNVTDSPYDYHISDSISPFALCFETFGRV